MMQMAGRRLLCRLVLLVALLLGLADAATPGHERAEVQQVLGSALGDAQSAAAFAADKVASLNGYVKQSPRLDTLKEKSKKILNQELVARAFLKAAKANNAN